MKNNNRTIVINSDMLKAKRLEARYNHKTLAKDLGVSRQRYSSWEKSGQVPKTYIEKLNILLGLPIKMATAQMLSPRDRIMLTEPTTQVGSPPVPSMTNPPQSYAETLDRAEKKEMEVTKEMTLLESPLKLESFCKKVIITKKKREEIEFEVSTVVKNFNGFMIKNVTFTLTDAEIVLLQEWLNHE